MRTQEKCIEPMWARFLRVTPCIMPAVFAVLILLLYLLPAATLIGFSVGNVYALAGEDEPFAKLLLWSGIAVAVLGIMLTVMSFLPAVKESKIAKLWGSEWVAYGAAVLYLSALIVNIVATVMIKGLLIFSTGIGVILAIVLAAVFLILSVVFTVVWRVKKGERYELAKAQERLDIYKADGKPLAMERPRVETTESMENLRLLLKKRFIQWIWQIIISLLLIYFFATQWLMARRTVVDVTQVETGISATSDWKFGEYFLKYGWGIILAVAIGIVFSILCIAKQAWALKRIKGYKLKISIPVLIFELALGFFFLRNLSALFSYCCLILYISIFIIEGKIKKIKQVETYETESADYETAIKVYSIEMKRYREYQSFKRAEHALG